MNKANKPFLQDFAKAIRTDPTKADKSFYGVVKEIVEDESGKVRGYKVSLGGEDDIIECRKFAGADIGDTVMVTLMANGTAVVTGRRDGDGDASTAKADAAEAKANAEDAMYAADDAARTATDFIDDDHGIMRVTNPTGESIVIGPEEGRHVKINEDGIHLFVSGDTEGTNEIAHFGYGETQDREGQTTSPYYNLGKRDTTYGIGTGSVVEGGSNSASGWYSHAEGVSTHAYGNISHSEGYETDAGGDNSHAEGYGTVTGSDNQHAQGKFNVIDRGEKYADIVGNGTSQTDLSNAFALEWNGNGRYAGDVYVGCNADSSGGTKLAKITDIPPLGEIIEASAEGNIALTANTAKVVASITLPKGKYTIQGNARFNSISSAGTRLLSISTNTSMNYQGYNEVYVPTNTNGYVNVTRIMEITEDNTTVNLLGYCGSAINCSYRYLKAVRNG